MADGQFKHGIAAARLDSAEYAENFSDLHPPLDRHEALVESDRCYFCHDAPCMNACPTSIDIPLFIREISTGNPLGAAKTIFDQNIFGGMCARVCPTETLCEEVCVREIAEGKPVKIGLLQRYATDIAMREGRQFYERAAPTGKKVAVVGAGPAGLACAHRLAMHGHSVHVFDAREKAGGLNEYGIAAYKTTHDFAQAEVDYITSIGGIEIYTGKALGRDMTLEDLGSAYDAVFLAWALRASIRLAPSMWTLPAATMRSTGLRSLRQAPDPAMVPVGRRVVVIGGGMTAIDAAVQSRALGADEVTVCYRGPREKMKASAYEQEIARARGVTLRFEMQPVKVHAQGGAVTGVEFRRHGESVVIACDQVFKAIGQVFAGTPAVNRTGRRAHPCRCGRAHHRNPGVGRRGLRQCGGRPHRYRGCTGPRCRNEHPPHLDGCLKCAFMSL